MVMGEKKYNCSNHMTLVLSLEKMNFSTTPSFTYGHASPPQQASLLISSSHVMNDIVEDPTNRVETMISMDISVDCVDEYYIKNDFNDDEYGFLY